MWFIHYISKLHRHHSNHVDTLELLQKAILTQNKNLIKYVLLKNDVKLEKLTKSIKWDKTIGFEF